MALDCESLRSEFPQLEGGLVYLDNAASTLKPRRVVEAMKSFTYRSYANVHRGIHRLSREASRAYEEAHERVARLVGGSWDEVVFLRNTTEAMQTAAMLLAANKLIGPGDEVLVTEADHHSTLLPWLAAARMTGAKLKLLPVGPDGVPLWSRLPEYLSEKTRVVAFGHVSNVTGAVAPVEEVAREAHKMEAIVVLDAAQSVPHMPVDFKKLGVDLAAFSGHKMMGPTGIGVLWGRRDLLQELEPHMGGGGTVSRVKLEAGEVKVEWAEPPWRFEAGTPPIIEAVGLAEAADMLREVGPDRVAMHEAELVGRLMKALEPLAGEGLLRYAGPSEPERRHGIVSFTLKGMSPEEVGLLLDRRGIAVRTGLHCAHILHDRISMPGGSVRASFYLYNCPSEAEALAAALHEAAERAKRRSSQP